MIGAAAVALSLSACGPPTHVEGFYDGRTILEKPLNYETLYKDIVEPRCQSCHSETGSAKGMPFWPYSTLKLTENLRRWTAPEKGTSKDSQVYRAITRTTKRRMPPPPYDPLTQDQIEFIVRWIDAGNPEF